MTPQFHAFFKDRRASKPLGQDCSAAAMIVADPCLECPRDSCEMSKDVSYTTSRSSTGMQTVNMPSSAQREAPAAVAVWQGLPHCPNAAGAATQLTRDEVAASLQAVDTVLEDTSISAQGVSAIAEVSKLSTTGRQLRPRRASMHPASDAQHSAVAATASRASRRQADTAKQGHGQGRGKTAPVDACTSRNSTVPASKGRVSQTGGGDPVGAANAQRVLKLRCANFTV